MGRDVVEFGPDELRLVGGDYGQVVLEGTTPEARRACDALVAATRRRDGGVELVSLVAESDDTPDLIEDRHAGREGTPERGVGPDDADDEGGVEGGTGDGPAPRVE